MAYPIFAIPLAIVLSGTFHGFLYEGFEQGGYSSCEASMSMPAQLRLRAGDIPSFPEAAPARFTPRAALAIGLSRASSNHGDGKVRYIEWRGRYVGPSYYGTWGLAPFGVEIDDVIIAREPRVSDCPAVNRFATSPAFAFDTAAVITEAWTHNPLVRRMKRTELRVRRDFVPDELAVSADVVRALRASGVPARHAIPEPWEPTDGAQFWVRDVWRREDGRVRVVMSASWFPQLMEHGLDWPGGSGYASNSDTIVVDCGNCDGMRGLRELQRHAGGRGQELRQGRRCRGGIPPCILRAPT